MVSISTGGLVGATRGMTDDDGGPKTGCVTGIAGGGLRIVFS